MLGSARATPRVKGNRLVAAGHAPADITDPNQWIASYQYLGDNRRCRKMVQNRGVETCANDGGNTTLDLHYAGVAQSRSAGSRPCEDRNGSNQTVRQYLFGAMNEPVWMDVNSAPSTGNDAYPDVTTGAETDAADPGYEMHCRYDPDHPNDPNPYKGKCCWCRPGKECEGKYGLGWTCQRHGGETPNQGKYYEFCGCVTPG